MATKSPQVGLNLVGEKAFPASGRRLKYSKPVDDDEAKLRFISLWDSEKGRVVIQLIYDYRIKPVETVEVGEIEPADDP